MSKILYIDAGHGGIDANGNYTTPPQNGKFFDHKGHNFHKQGIFYEGVWNRTFAETFTQMATALGYHCVPVYNPIADTRLGVRTDTANKYYNEVAQKKGLYLSFHSNAFKSTNRGFYLFYHPNSARGLQIGSAIVNPINDLFVRNGSVSVNPLREGWMDANKTQIYHVLSATNMPALLFEFGFFDNLQDAEMIFDKEFQNELAATILAEFIKIDLP
jgi:N-acetylmuramoyl-L-alanine amidase